MAPLTRQRKKALAAEAAAAPSIGPRDRLSVLPFDVLCLIIGFLPVKDAVRTCVLGRHWRHLWKSASGLRIGCGGGDGKPTKVKELREFMHNLLRARGDSPLETFELCLPDYGHDDIPDMNSWVRHAVMRGVRVLSINFLNSDPFKGVFELDESPLISRHLTRLQLTWVDLNDRFLDFSSCLVLEDLEISYCYLCLANRISSQSLKTLSFIGSCHFNETSRTQIIAPNLVSLRMEVSVGRTPFLERMPFLMEATIKVSTFDDNCFYERDYSGDCGDEHCVQCNGVCGYTNSCVVLQSLSEASNLALLPESDTFIFRRDLRWCPIFSNLKTLLLNERWCMHGFGALECMLEHSPVLENLTVWLYCEGSTGKVQIDGSPDPAGRLTATNEHLKLVRIRSGVLNQDVFHVLKFMNGFNLCLNFI